MIEVGEEGRPVQFAWEIVDKCQYECTYCYSTEFNANDFFTKNKYHESYKLVLARLRRMEFDFEVDILGGEPTLHPNMIESIAALNDMPHCKKISLYTNGTERLDYYKEMDVGDKLVICFSYHPEYHKKIIHKYRQAFAALSRNRMFVEVNLYPKQEYFNQVETLIEQLEEEGIPFGVNTIRENKFWDGVVDAGFIQRFGKHLHDPRERTVKHVSEAGVEYIPESEIFRKKISYTGYLCEAQRFQITIDGDIINICSGEKVSLTATTKEVVAPKIRCPITQPCPCPDMLHYKKVQ